MPVLEWAVPSAASLFVPLLLAAHYGGAVLGPVTAFFRKVPDTPWGPANSLLHAARLRPAVMSAILHGVLVGPVAPTQDERARISAPTLVLAHRNDLIHPFDDAANLVAQMPAAHLERAWSMVELRLRPERLTRQIEEFVDQAWRPRPRRARAV